jgi:branched-subunit amino acid ABC-type transport system permease component
MEAGTLTSEGERLPALTRLAELMRRRPALTAAAILALLAAALIATHGLHDVAQTGLNGLSLGSIYALGAVGLTLVYGILKLVNFAHGDLLTFGAFMAFMVAGLEATGKPVAGIMPWLPLAIAIVALAALVRYLLPERPAALTPSGGASAALTRSWIQLAVILAASVVLFAVLGFAIELIFDVEVFTTEPSPLPLALAILWAMLTTALVGVFFEVTMWGPMRSRGAGLLQLLLMSIGLAFVLRAVVYFGWGTEIRTLDVDQIATVKLLDLSIGRTELIVMGVGFGVLLAVGLMLRYTRLGKQMRALSDNLDLAETSGIDTKKVVVLTWVFAAGLAGLAGVLAGAVTTVYTELGFELLLILFAAVVLGGIGDAFGALVAGLVLGLMTEWSTLLIDPRWKITVGFLVLLLVLIIRPQGIFGRARTI